MLLRNHASLLIVLGLLFFVLFSFWGFVCLFACCCLFVLVFILQPSRTQNSTPPKEQLTDKRTFQQWPDRTALELDFDLWILTKTKESSQLHEFQFWHVLFMSHLNGQQNVYEKYIGVLRSLWYLNRQRKFTTTKQNTNTITNTEKILPFTRW